ncbi:MAG: LamG-like jellyroll fold domain-containing protein [Myxococcota bacterium]|jgi:hypothetical protein|nr:LamG-like jellyroll fold domain-containing protein [Myxococcota bacterium]
MVLFAVTGLATGCLTSYDTTKVSVVEVDSVDQEAEQDLASSDADATEQELAEVEQELEDFQDFEQDTLPDDGRVRDGLLALYRFDEGQGPVANNQVAELSTLELRRFGEPERPLPWRADAWGLHFSETNDRVQMLEHEALISRLQQSGALTIELWLSVDGGTGLRDRCRLFGYEQTTTVRNFAVQLLPDGRPQGRLNGAEWNADALLPRDQATHLVLTAANGEARWYLDATPTGNRQYGGDFGSWASEGYQVCVGNICQADQDRHFEGDILLVAVYERALSPEDVTQNFEAGPPTP